MSRKDSRLIDRFIIKALMGALIGIAICMILYACGVHDSLILEDKMGFIIQIVGSALLGVICNGGSVAYEIDSWGLTKATLIHYTVSLGVFILACKLLHWFPSDYLLIVLVFFTLAYAVIWMINYFTWKRTVKKINEELEHLVHDEQEGGAHS